MSTYKNNIPQPNDDIGAQSQQDLLNNFSELDTQFGNNHIAFSAGTDNGKHKKIEFNTNNAPGAPIGTQSEIYTADATPEAYFINAANTALISGIKAWCTFVPSAAPTLGATSFNITSVTRLAKGQYQLAFTNPLATSTYAVLATYTTSTNADGIGDTVQSYNITVNNFTILTRSLITATLEDIGGSVSVLIIGN